MLNCSIVQYYQFWGVTTMRIIEKTRKPILHEMRERK